MTRRIWLAPAIAFVAGCSPFGSGYSGPQACDVLSGPLARSVIGNNAHQTRSEKVGPYTTECEYHNGLNGVTVTTGTWGWLGRTVEGPRLAGIGDEAYMTTFGVLARKGGSGVKVLVSLSEPLGTPVQKTQMHEEQREKQLASELIAKL